jgi:hypothetical protein
MEVLLGAIFSMWSAPRLYHLTDRGELVSAMQLSTVKRSELVGEQSVRGLLQFGRCELLLIDAGNSGTGIFREPRVRGRSAVGSCYQTKTSEHTAD